MKDHKGVYQSLAMFAAILIAAILIHRSGWLSEPNVPKALLKPTAALPERDSAEPVIYDMEKIKKEQKISEPVSMGDVYNKYPQGDVGKNLIKSWSRVKPEEKERVAKGLEEKITEARSALAGNPEDKGAKHTLFIAETLKNLTASNFNIDVSKRKGEQQ